MNRRVMTYALAVAVGCGLAVVGVDAASAAAPVARNCQYGYGPKGGCKHDPAKKKAQRDRGAQKCYEDGKCGKHYSRATDDRNGRPTYRGETDEGNTYVIFTDSSGRQRYVFVDTPNYVAPDNAPAQQHTDDPDGNTEVRKAGIDLTGLPGI